MDCPRLASLPARELSGGLRLAEAQSGRSRALGLALLDSLPAGLGLLIPRCRSIHTFGMRFPLDVLFLDARGRVVRLARSVPPRRVVSCAAARCVVEAAQGDGERFAAALSAGGAAHGRGRG
jgi:uncharacterized protein